ncbi:helix-turn-helix transcriptional regulator [Streptomyces sp. NPDC046939]|uniref:helix-turn-helix domain-containing protein n=1 Tax=Streptomyces sp. NPDC046939 TaxID=3155376 RepID=UPI0033CBCA2B
MALRSEPTARQMRLATELRRLRRAAGLTSREAAALLGVSSAQISQIESALTGVSEKRLRLMASHYACTDEELISALAAMAGDRTRGWWEEYRGSLPTSFMDVAELEHHATRRRDVELLLIPGLLQTDDYARATFSSRIPAIPEEQLELRVQHRMRRKAILNRPVPVPYDAVIHEAALRIRVRDRAVARAQLTQLLEASELDHISVRIIPFDLDGFGGTWSTMMLAEGTCPQLDTAVRDAPHGVTFIDCEAQLEVFRALFRRVEAVALEPERSRDFIHALAKEV